MLPPFFILIFLSQLTQWAKNFQYIQAIPTQYNRNYKIKLYEKMCMQWS